MTGYLEQGIELLKQVENEKAIQIFKLALQENPDNSEVYRHIGLAYFNLGQYQDALDHWDKCVQLDPNSHRTWWNLGQLNEILANYEDALYNYKEAARTAYRSPEKAKRYEEWAKRVEKKLK